MSRVAAAALLRIGIAMLVLCIACRFAIRTEAAAVGDDLAIIACLALAVVAGLFLRFGPRNERDHK